MALCFFSSFEDKKWIKSNYLRAKSYKIPSNVFDFTNVNMSIYNNQKKKANNVSLEYDAKQRLKPQKFCQFEIAHNFLNKTIGLDFVCSTHTLIQVLHSKFRCDALAWKQQQQQQARHSLLWIAAILDAYHVVCIRSCSFFRWK